MTARERIEAVLEHFDYCLIGLKGHEFDNVIVIDFPTTNGIVFRDLTITFGAERVSKHKGKIKVTRWMKMKKYLKICTDN